MGKGSARRPGENSELLRKNWPFDKPKAAPAEQPKKEHSPQCSFDSLWNVCDCGLWEE